MSFFLIYYVVEPVSVLWVLVRHVEGETFFFVADRKKMDVHSVEVIVRRRFSSQISLPRLDVRIVKSRFYENLKRHSCPLSPRTKLHASVCADLLRHPSIFGSVGCGA